MGSRKRRHEAFLPESRNPFEDSGLSKEVVEALIANGDESLVIGLKGLKRTVARAFHPDVTPNATSEGSNVFDRVMRSTGRLVDEMSDSQRLTLGKAYTKRRDGVARSVQEKIEYESKDLHDGTLISQMIDMVADTGESIASAKGKRFLIRPLDFSLNKPENHTTVSGYDWYPPLSAKTPMLDVSRDGSVTWVSMRQVALSYMLKKEQGTKVSTEDYREERDQLSVPFQKLIDPILAERPLSGSVDVNKILVDVQDGRVLIYDSDARQKIAMIEPKESLIRFGEGVYVFGAKNKGRSLGVMEGTMYLRNPVADESTGSNAVDSLILGSVDEEFVNLQRKIIFDKPSDFERGLPARAKNDNEFSQFTVPNRMYRYAQKYYSPILNKQSYMLAVDKDRQMTIVGNIIAITDN